MGRSVKKGPFVNKKLLARIEELNAANAVSYTHLDVYKRQDL